MNKLIKYYKHEFEGMIIFDCNTDFSIYDYAPRFTLYKRGWFRDYEQEVVVMITNLMKAKKDYHSYVYGFKNESEALKYIKKKIKQ